MKRLLPSNATLATISRFRAIVVLGRLRASGFLAWLLWLVVHLAALTGFKNRVSVLFNWMVAFLGRGRAQRVITAQQMFGRHALEAQAAVTRTVPPTSTRARTENAFVTRVLEQPTLWMIGSEDDLPVAA